MNEFDLIVIGSGPGGYVGAIRAAQLGFKTACVEKYETLGGTCLNVGCIPSKTLLHSTETFQMMKEKGSELGIEVRELSFNFPQMQTRKQTVVKSHTDGIAGLFKKDGVEWIKGHASFLDPFTLDVSGRQIQAKRFLLATGSKPIEIPSLSFQNEKILSSTSALSLKEIPPRLIIIGAGAIGLEMGSIFARLGSDVSIIEMMDEIALGMDATIAKNLARILEKQKIKFYLGTKFESAEIGNTVKIKTSKQELEADKVLVAVGRKAYTDKLNLDRIGISTNKRGEVEVNDRFQTAHPHIYAIGDVIGGAMLAHKASEEAMAAVEIMKGLSPTLHYYSIPNVIYTHPEAVAVGLTEKEARAKIPELLIGQCYFKANSRARCIDDTEGLVKVIGDKKSGRLLGLHILGPHASEMAGEGVIALNKGATIEELANSSHAHPTLTEALKEAFLNALGRQIHF